MKIAIIGCGYAGISTALAIKDHQITIFEQSDELSPVGAGILLQPLGLKILELYGIKERAIAIGDKITRLVGSTSNNLNILNLQYQKYDSDLYGVGIHRGHLYNELLKILDDTNIEIRLNEIVTEIIPTLDKCSFISNEKEYSNFDIVIVSNGASSSLRNILPGYKYQKEYPWGAFWGVFSNTGFSSEVLYQKYSGTHKLLGLLPCGIDPVNNQKLINFFWSERKNRVQQTLDKGIDHFKSEVIAFDPIAEPIVSQIESFDDLLYTNYYDVHCATWNIGNTIFIGDTVHGMSPQLGIGLNMALLDGYLIGNIINQENFRIKNLSLLKQIRNQQIIYYYLSSLLLTRFFQSDSILLGKIRDIIFPHLPNIKFLDQLMIDSLCGHKTSFFGSLSPENQIDLLTNKIKNEDH